MRVVLAVALALTVVIPAFAAPGTSRDDPIPYQKRAIVRDFEMRVSVVYPDATDEIMDFVGRRAEPPGRGNVYALIVVEATYVGDAVGVAYDLASPSFIWRDGNTEITTIECPDAGFWSLNGQNADADIFPDGDIELYYCVEVPKGEFGNLLMYFDVGNRQFVFFALTPGTPTSVATPTA